MFDPMSSPTAQTGSCYAPPATLPHGQSGEAIFLVENSETQILYPPERLAHLVYAYCSYQTPMVIEPESNWSAPNTTPDRPMWDGVVRLSKIHKDGSVTIPTGLLPLCQWVCEQWGFPFLIRDNRVEPPEELPASFGSIVDRPYQINAVNAFLREHRGVLDISPRGGKTRIAGEIQRCLNVPLLWIAPKTNIVEATHKMFEEHIGKNYAMILKGQGEIKKAMTAKVVICTYKTAESLPQEFLDTRIALTIDETHHSASTTLQTLSQRCVNAYYRLGLTGTFFRSGDDDIAMHSVLSKTIARVTAQDLVDLGYLVPADVVMLPVDCPRLQGVSGNYSTGPGPYGIWKHEYRNSIVAWAATHLANHGRKVLVLVATKVQGKEVEAALREHFPRSDSRKYQTVEFVSTDRSDKVCSDIIDAYNEGDAVKIMIGTTKVSEGTDLPPCDALVYAMGRKAEVELIQAAYRVCTKIDGKPKRSLIVDLSDNHHRKLLDHAKDRVTHYNAQSTFDVSIMGSLEEFQSRPL